MMQTTSGTPSRTGGQLVSSLSRMLERQRESPSVLTPGQAARTHRRGPTSTGDQLQHSLTRLQQQLRCALCGDIYDLHYRQPVLVHLGHSACSRCLDHALEQQYPPNASTPLASFSCPLCEFLIPLPIAVATSSQTPTHRALPINFVLLDLLEVWYLCAPADSISPGGTEQLLRCGLCVEPTTPATAPLSPSPVRSHCEWCSLFLCAFHTEAHHRSRDTAAHSPHVHSLATLRTKLQQSFSMEDTTSHPITLCTAFGSAPSACELHPHLPLELFCRECTRPLCVTCASKHGALASTTQPPTPHIIVELASHCSQLQERIQGEHLKTVQTAHYNVQYQCLALEQRKAAVTQEARDRTLKIEQQFDALVAALSARKLALLEDIETTRVRTHYELAKQHEERSMHERLIASVKDDLVSLRHSRHAAALCEMDAKLAREVERLSEPEDPITIERNKRATASAPPVDLLGDEKVIMQLLRSVRAEVGAQSPLRAGLAKSPIASAQSSTHQHTNPSTPLQHTNGTLSTSSISPVGASPPSHFAPSLVSPPRPTATVLDFSSPIPAPSRAFDFQAAAVQPLLRPHLATPPTARPHVHSHTLISPDQQLHRSNEPSLELSPHAAAAASTVTARPLVQYAILTQPTESALSNGVSTSASTPTTHRDHSLLAHSTARTPAKPISFADLHALQPDEQRPLATERQRSSDAATPITRHHHHSARANTDHLTSGLAASPLPVRSTAELRAELQLQQEVYCRYIASKHVRHPQ